MEDRICKLKTDFDNVINTNKNIINIFEILKLRIDKLKIYYSEFIKDNNNQTLYIFGLDSLRFQSKIIDIEYDDMKRIYLSINNRMYCEYFKLYNIVVEYIKKYIKDKKIIENIKDNSFPVYKDLEPFKEYKVEIILEIHDNILLLVSLLTSYLNARENELKSHKDKNRLGLNIDNFVTSFNYELLMKREKIQMFLTYIEYFHKLHSKYLKRFSNKVQLMYTHINSDINFEENIQLSKNSKNASDNLDDYNDSGDSTPMSDISHAKVLKSKNKRENINSSIQKITSMLQLGTRSVSDNLYENNSDDTRDMNIINNILDDENINDTINRHFENINKSCDNIIQSDNLFIELSIQPENTDKEQIET